MSLEGFDARWKDLPDYILGITKEIWEDRGIATLHRYYAETMPVRSPSSLVTGSENVIAATMATLAEFPDRTLLGEDVIWSGDALTGFLSSHRIVSQANRAWHTAPQCAGRSTAGTTAGEHLAGRQARMCTSWASAMPNSGHGVCGASLSRSTKLPSGTRFCYTPDDEKTGWSIERAAGAKEQAGHRA